MKVTEARRFNKKAFSIVELLTIMSILVLIMSLLLPALNQVRKHGKKVKQKAQFHSISVAMELFNAEWDGFPDSDALGADSQPYCGAMKFCEAMVGQDLLGYHPASVFRRDDDDPVTGLYPPNPSDDNLDMRSKPYLQLENANAYKLEDIYGSGNVGSFTDKSRVLCDVYGRIKHGTTGKKIGMPILYYKANVSGTTHPITDNSVATTAVTNIYDHTDNDTLVQLGVPKTTPLETHPMAGTTATGIYVFYDAIWNDKITSLARPHRSDSYILLSAGFDGLYGTNDDVFNFGK